MKTSLTIAILTVLWLAADIYKVTKIACLSVGIAGNIGVVVLAIAYFTLSRCYKKSDKPVTKEI